MCQGYAQWAFYKDYFIYHFQQPYERGTITISISLIGKLRHKVRLHNMSKVTSKANDGAGIMTHTRLPPNTRLMTTVLCFSGLFLLKLTQIT